MVVSMIKLWYAHSKTETCVLNISIVLFYAYWSSALMCVYIMCVPGIQGVQKRLLDPLELELLLVVSNHVGATDQTQVLC